MNTSTKVYILTEYEVGKITQTYSHNILSLIRKVVRKNFELVCNPRRSLLPVYRNEYSCTLQYTTSKVNNALK